MKKAQITIDLSKIDKTKIIEREFTTKAGEVVKQKLYKLDLVPLKEPKFVKEGPTWLLEKVGFLAEPQTKEERDAKVPSVFLGDVTSFREHNKTPDGDNYPQQPMDDSVPF